MRIAYYKVAPPHKKQGLYAALGTTKSGKLKVVYVKDREKALPIRTAIDALALQNLLDDSKSRVPSDQLFSEVVQDSSFIKEAKAEELSKYAQEVARSINLYTSVITDVEEDISNGRTHFGEYTLEEFLKDKIQSRASLIEDLEEVTKELKERGYTHEDLIQFINNNSE